MPKSEIWRHFTEKDSEKKVTCLYCPQQLSVANKSTCSLIRHLTKKHPNIKIRRHSSTEAQCFKEEILLVNNDDTDFNSEPAEGPVLDYEIEEREDSETEEVSEPDQKPYLRIINSKSSKLNYKPVEQQMIAAMTEAKRQISDALFSMKSLNKRQIEHEDEYDHFGSMIASKIRKIQDMDQREVVMHSVYNVVYQSLMKNI